LNLETAQYEPPVFPPTEGTWRWDEPTLSWIVPPTIEEEETND